MKFNCLLFFFHKQTELFDSASPCKVFLWCTTHHPQVHLDGEARSWARLWTERVFFFLTPFWIIVVFALSPGSFASRPIRLVSQRTCSVPDHSAQNCRAWPLSCKAVNRFLLSLLSCTHSHLLACAFYSHPPIFPPNFFKVDAKNSLLLIFFTSYVKIWLKFRITFANAEFQDMRYYLCKFSAPVPNNCYLHGTPRPSRVHPIKVGSELAASSIRNPFQASPCICTWVVLWVTHAHLPRTICAHSQVIYPLAPGPPPLSLVFAVVARQVVLMYCV